MRAQGIPVDFHEDENGIHINIGIEKDDYGDLTGYSKQQYEDETVRDE
jgi:hypothetical protein